jgi:hypothetical protein
MEEFFRENPNERFEIRVRKVSEKASRNQVGYYFAEIVPKCQQGLRGLGHVMTKDQTHEFIKQFSPIMIEEFMIGDQLHQRLRSFSDDDWDQECMREYIDDIIRWAAEELYIIINPPSTQQTNN